MLAKQLKIKQKNKKLFFVMLLATLGAGLLGNMLAGKGVIRAGKRQLEHARIFNSTSSFNKKIIKTNLN